LETKQILKIKKNKSKEINVWTTKNYYVLYFT
jgi:hypothetical protein